MFCAFFPVLVLEEKNDKCIDCGWDICDEERYSFELLSDQSLLGGLLWVRSGLDAIHLGYFAFHVRGNHWIVYDYRGALGQALALRVMLLLRRSERLSGRAHLVCHEAPSQVIRLSETLLGEQFLRWKSNSLRRRYCPLMAQLSINHFEWWSLPLNWKFINQKL